MGEIALLEPLHPEAEALLAARHRLRRGLRADVAGVAAIVTRGLGRVSAATLSAAGPSLRCVARVGSGTEHIDVAAATAAGIPVVYAPDAFTQSTAEHALALLLSVCRRVVPLSAATRSGDWGARDGPLGLDLGGRRLGVVGMGRIGRRFAEMARGIGMEVVSWSRSAHPGTFPAVSLDELFQTSDVVSLHLALNEETNRFLDAGRIGMMKPGAVLLNVSRGGLVDEDALAEALHAGHLRAVGLDVLAEEPPRAHHPLLCLPQVLVTPHTAALTERAFRDACLLVARAVDGWLRGDPPDRALLRNPEALPPAGAPLGTIAATYPYGTAHAPALAGGAGLV